MDKALQACQTMMHVLEWMDEAMSLPSYKSRNRMNKDALTRMAEISRNLALEEAAQAAEVWRATEPTETSPFLPNYGQARVDAATCIRALMNTPHRRITNEE